MDYDVIVIGAGPAGSMTAYRCAEAGLQTLLVDKAQFPRVKPCGGALSLRSLQALQFAGIQIPSSLIEQHIFGFQFMGPEKKPFEYRSRDFFAYTVKRDQFDDYLAQQAVKAGAEFKQSCTFRNLEQHEAYVQCLTDQGKFTGRVIIGADGAASRVGQITRLRIPRKAHQLGIAVEADVPISEKLWNHTLDPSLLVLWLLNIPKGYFWVFPRKTSLSIGVGGIAAELGNVPNLLRGLTRMFCQWYQLPPFKLKQIRGHQLTAFETLIPLSNHRVFLIGDAAGFIDVFSGQGICYALESGIIGAQTAIAIIKGNYSLTQASGQYRQRITQRFGEELQFSWFIMRLVHAHLYGGLRLARLMKWPGQLVFDLARGITDYYRMKRNPLSLISRLFIKELKTRLLGIFT
ncbi:MAG: NAD(P)/FAD-dependent oxidoreductase [Promethearchaeota archaeon]